MKQWIRLASSGVAALVLATVAAPGPVVADATQVGLIEPLSGPIAAVGQDALKQVEYTIDQINARGGVQLEVIGLDNAMSAEKTTEQLNRAVDDGITYVMQGVGSNHALNIIEFVNKHNRRNPGDEMVYLNHSAVTTAFTNELCSFWHFRFDANVDMKVAGLVTQISRDDTVERVYLLNQNYAYGKSFQAAANRLLAERAPNVEIVGDELITPFGKVLDFTPYIAKIQASGADTILTGNWGPDMVRFVRGAEAAGLDVQFYSIYGGITSSISGYGEDAANIRLMQITELHENQDGIPADVVTFMNGFKERYGDTWYADRYRWALEMLAAAIEQAGTDDPIPVARALEGMSFGGPLGDVQMRADDHQIQLPLVVSSLTADAAIPVVYGGNDFGVAFETAGLVARADTTLPTTCEMDRPN
jgi:branched-chain amino acid transport system substrate-binding protein